MNILRQLFEKVLDVKNAQQTYDKLLSKNNDEIAYKPNNNCAYTMIFAW